ncbi:MAG: ATP-binding protein [Synechococcales bacterium]|nr:ATP-binding protein [Synechococcales bacterium]
MSASTPKSKDLSLYELALASERPPVPLKVSPATFKGMVESLITLLIQQEISAHIWTKMPRGKVWDAPFQRYAQAVRGGQSIYLLRRLRDQSPQSPYGADGAIADSSASPPAAPATESLADLDEGSDGMESEMDIRNELAGMATPESPSTMPLEIWLSPDSRLRREYFVLAIAPGFQIILLAHRPRSARHITVSTTAAPHTINGIKSAETIAETSDRKHPLLGICSLDPATLQRVMGGIQQAVESDCVLSLTDIDSLSSLLNQWKQPLQMMQTSALDPTLAGYFSSIQFQRYEEVWHSGAAARRHADNATELQLENEELLNAIRLKDEFFKNVGQELRTPLATMKTALSLLGSPNIKPNQRQRYLDMLSQECDRQSALITSVLDLVQLENVDDHAPLQPLRLIDVVPGVVSTYQPLAQEKGIMLAYTIPEDLPAVTCLNTWLRQIVINLLHNSIKFTPEGGQVWVRANQQGDYVQIEFRDTGVGIAPTDIPKIFNRFYRVRPAAGEDTSGAGLGLSIVQQLLLRCSGSISVKSRLGEGSTFNVLLPVYRRDG